MPSLFEQLYNSGFGRSVRYARDSGSVLSIGGVSR